MILTNGNKGSDDPTMTPERLAELQRELRTLIAEVDPAVVVVERVFFQVNVRTAMAVGQAQGALDEALKGQVAPRRERED